VGGSSRRTAPGMSLRSVALHGHDQVGAIRGERLLRIVTALGTGLPSFNGGFNHTLQSFVPWIRLHAAKTWGSGHQVDAVVMRRTCSFVPFEPILFLTWPEVDVCGAEWADTPLGEDPHGQTGRPGQASPQANCSPAVRLVLLTGEGQGHSHGIYQSD